MVVKMERGIQFAPIILIIQNTICSQVVVFESIVYCCRCSLSVILDIICVACIEPCHS